MRPMLFLAMLAPTLARAHEGPAGHAHPHGLEAAVLAVAAVAVIGWLVWKATR
jgi:hypothetical protein